MTLRKGPDGWKVRRQELLHGETVTGDRRGFTDVTASSGIDFQAHHNPLWASPEWEPTKYEIMKYATAGVSAADFDGDGWDDLFFCDAKAPRLYRNRGDGTFADVTARVGLPTELPGCSVAIFADFDNDGRKDLFLVRRHRVEPAVPQRRPRPGRADPLHGRDRGVRHRRHVGRGGRGRGLRQRRQGGRLPRPLPGPAQEPADDPLLHPQQRGQHPPEERGELQVPGRDGRGRRPGGRADPRDRLGRLRPRRPHRPVRRQRLRPQRPVPQQRQRHLHGCLRGRPGRSTSGTA